MLRVTLTDAVLPALSVTVPAITWPAPSDVTVCMGGQLSTPEPVSEQVKLTITFELFQPLPLGKGIVDGVIVGGVMSILTFTPVVAILPALSVAVPEMI